MPLLERQNRTIENKTAVYTPGPESVFPARSGKKRIASIEVWAAKDEVGFRFQPIWQRYRTREFRAAWRALDARPG